MTTHVQGTTQPPWPAPAPTRAHECLSSIAARIAAERRLWPGLVDFDPVRRYYAKIDAGPDVEAWLLTWLPRQGTQWHDHGDSAGSFVVLQGELTERTDTRAPVSDRLRVGAHLQPVDSRQAGADR